MLGTKYLYLASVLLLGACAYGSVDLGDGKYTQASAITGQGGTYKIGDKIDVILTSCKLSERQIDFATSTSFERTFG